jgi:uncharacterized protein (TIGR03437 family)
MQGRFLWFLIAVSAGAQTVPKSATRPPVVLLNGWVTGYVNSCPAAADSTSTFGNLAKYLISDGVPVVYFFDNCRVDPNATIEALGNDLAAFLAGIKYDDGSLVPQVDIVAHSMGGLIARSYLAGLQTNGSLAPPADPRIRKLILIGTPNFGSFVAENFATILTPGTQSTELIPGSAFLWNLATWNQRVDDLRGVDAIAIIGNAGTYTNALTGATLANASDGIVSTTSASLSFVAQNSAVTRIVPYCHVDPSVFTNASLQPYNCNAAGIANITSESHLTGQIVRSFLAGNSNWQSIGAGPSQDIYLTTNGGTFFALVNIAGQYVSDISQVQWGTVALQNGGDTNTIFFNDFAGGTGTYQVSSTSLGSINCGSVVAAVGYFAAARCKIGATIISIAPAVANTAARLIAAGSTITISGAVLGSQCNGCKVTANGQSLTLTSWKSNAITAKLPSNLSGLVTITVGAQTGTDSMNIMVQPASGTGNVTGVVNAGSYQAAIAPGAWVAIFGTNLASTTYTWQESDFVNGQPPTTLQGVSVTIDGKSAAVEYVSPTQINVLMPDDSNTGSVPVQVTVNGQPANSMNAQLQQYSPAFFTTDGTTIAAQHADYSLVSSLNPAKPGETILLYGTGFGASTNAAAVQVKIGGAPASVAFAGVVELGLEQLNVVVPAGVSGNPAVVASVGGASTQSGATIPVQ